MKQLSEPLDANTQATCNPAENTTSNHINKKLKFTKIPDQSFYYYLQDNEDRYYKVENDKLVRKVDINIEDASFYFRLKLTGNKANEVFIYTNDDRQEEKIMYDLSSNNLKLVKDPLNAKVESTSFMID